MKLICKYMIPVLLLLYAGGTDCYGQNTEAGNATKSEIISGKDPSGVIMTITAVSVIFSTLLCLSLFFSLSGKMHTRSGQRKTEVHKKENKEMNDEVALAIAMALEQECSAETEAAIALALHQYLNDTVHDEESFVITIKPTLSAWASRYATLRQLPDKK